ncbi:hypothetical protein CYMTET_54643 [Cymbomonas tetramitiformis]|uniref:Potassium channel domain-containing protein n=1 Tax=Cymbomonas tetramitiformis TaxID=36881 RepID=A0AAE0BES2_9CHLO|nr:hypothetical protein CYMTET_54643 [Cymbomonas tetramitiformis]
MAGAEQDIADGADWHLTLSQAIACLCCEFVILLCSIPLHWAYERYAKTQDGTGRVHLLKKKVIGDRFQAAHRRYWKYLRAWELCNFALSALTLHFWISKTYAQAIPDTIYRTEKLTSLFFLLSFMFDFLRWEFSPKILTRFQSFVDLLSFSSLFLQRDHIDSWLSFSFLRVYSAYRSYLVLEALDFNPLGFNDIKRQLIKTLLKFITMVVIMTGFLFTVEILGDVDGLTDKYIEADMGRVSFFSMFYMVMITISTVGYGDLSPVTVPGRFIICISIIYGVVFFTHETQQILDLQSHEYDGRGRYILRRKNSVQKDHVVIFGGMLDTESTAELETFLEELFNVRHTLRRGVEQAPDVVIMSQSAASPTLRELVTSSALHADNITLLQGNPFAEEDLDRCQVAKCGMLFVFPNLYSSDPDAEDEHGILLASALLKVVRMARMSEDGEGGEDGGVARVVAVVRMGGEDGGEDGEDGEGGEDGKGGEVVRVVRMVMVVAMVAAADVDVVL